jgi:hypothetical protein
VKRLAAGSRRAEAGAGVDEKVKRVPEAKRASEKEKLLAEIADKRKSLTSRMKEWQKNADAEEKKIKL